MIIASGGPGTSNYSVTRVKSSERTSTVARIRRIERLAVVPRKNAPSVASHLIVGERSRVALRAQAGIMRRLPVLRAGEDGPEGVRPKPCARASRLSAAGQDPVGRPATSLGVPDLPPQIQISALLLMRNLFKERVIVMDRAIRDDNANQSEPVLDPSAGALNIDVSLSLYRLLEL